MTFTLGHMGLLAAQATGLGVHGASQGVVAALQPRGAQDTGREVKLHQLGPQTHLAFMSILDNSSSKNYYERPCIYQITDSTRNELLVTFIFCEIMRNKFR